MENLIKQLKKEYGKQIENLSIDSDELFYNIIDDIKKYKSLDYDKGFTKGYKEGVEERCENCQYKPNE